MTRGNMPAFPTQERTYAAEGHEQIEPVDGLTTREYFAAMVLSGFAANPDMTDQNAIDLADESVRLADKLIEALHSND